MTNSQLKQILDRVLTWPSDDQERLARVVEEIEELRSGNDLNEEEWAIVGTRSAQHDLASDHEIEEVFARYRHA